MSVAYLIAGSGGMLGTALQRVLTVAGARFEAPAEAALDITDKGSVVAAVRAFSASLTEDETGVLVNCAAYTNVERAEDDRELAYRVNGEAPGVLARAARDAGMAFVHVSTDFVFDGTKTGAYVETDVPNPLSAYGASKLAGERAVADARPDALIVRTAWVYGPAGVNFVTKILDFARDRDVLQVVVDEVGSPTYTIDLAAGIVGLVDAGAGGLFHLAGAGACSRYEFATSILAAAGLERELVPVPASAFPSKAARPQNSVLDCSRAAALGVTMPPWRSGLERFMAEL